MFRKNLVWKRPFSITDKKNLFCKVDLRLTVQNVNYHRYYLSDMNLMEKQIVRNWDKLVIFSADITQVMKEGSSKRIAFEGEIPAMTIG